MIEFDPAPVCVADNSKLADVLVSVICVPPGPAGCGKVTLSASCSFLPMVRPPVSRSCELVNVAPTDAEVKFGAVAVTLVLPATSGRSLVKALFTPPAILIGELVIVPTEVLLLTTVTDMVVPPETSCASTKLLPESRPVSTVMFASPNPIGDEKVNAPMPPGEVILNPEAAIVIVPFVEVKPEACTK